MDTADEIIQRINSQIEAEGEPTPISSEEFSRRQQILTASKMGFSRPIFRSSIGLRFMKRGRQSQDLDAKVGSAIITHVTNLVEQAWSQVHQGSGSVRVLLSPTVLPGSTIITLYGEPRPAINGEELFPNEIRDTSLDLAMDSLFKSVEKVSDSREDIELSQLQISGQMGKKLFTFANELISQDIELDMTWTKPSGKSSVESFTFERLIHIKSVLDKEVETTRPRTEYGIVQNIDIDGSFKLKPESDRRSIISLKVPLLQLEELRALWGERVEVVFTEKFISHPQRADKEPKHEFIRFTAAPVLEQSTFDIE